jgi:hypothetical protein
MSVVKSCLLDFWKQVYLATQHDLIATGQYHEMMQAGDLGTLADVCAMAANEAEARLLKAMRMHCFECLGTKRIYGEGHPPEGTPCPKCEGTGLLLLVGGAG